jgi:hypothetical protein
MREAEKKRLVKLIEEAGEGYELRSVVDIADYLLENGVIVPPCKVGDTVYRIVKMSTGVTTAIRAIRKEGKITGVIKPCEPTIKQFIRSVTVTKNNFIDCCENFGKTVFLSEAEAKYALKNRRSVSLVNGHIEE